MEDSNDVKSKRGKARDVQESMAITVVASTGEQVGDGVVQ